MKVRNMTSAKGNKIANQFIIENGQQVTFQSYDSTIATIDYKNAIIYIGCNWDYSQTTNKYRNMFFNEFGFYEIASAKDMRKALKNKEVYINNRRFEIAYTNTKNFDVA